MQFPYPLPAMDLRLAYAIIPYYFFSNFHFMQMLMAHVVWTDGTLKHFNYLLICFYKF